MLAGKPAALAVLLACSLAGAGTAQPLQLGRPGSPPPGSCASILDRADALEAQAKGATPTVAALRTVAAALLRTSENASPAQPRSVLLALTLAERLPLVEAVLPALDGTAQDLFVRDALALAAAVPEDPIALSLAVRDLLAPLMIAAADRSPWLWESSPAAADLKTLDPLVSQDPGLAGALSAIARRLVLADASPAYAALAAETRRRLVDAAALALAPPSWFPAQSKPAVLAQFADACRRLADEPRSVEPTRRLRRLAMLGRLAAGLSSQKGATATRAHQAFVKLATEGPSSEPGARDAEIARLEALVRASELLPRRDLLRDEKKVVRQFRPALRTMLDLARLSEADLLEVLPEALLAQTAEESVNSPKFIAAVAAHSRRLEDVAAIVAASDAILAAQGPPTPPTPANAEAAAREEFTLLANRLLAFAKVAYELGQKNEPATRDALNAALARVRALADDTRDLVLLPGEAELRARTDEASRSLIKTIDDDRTAWLKGWGSPDKHPIEIGERLRRLHRAMLLTGDAQAIVLALAGNEESSGNAWPGWEMNSQTLRTLAEGLEEQSRELAAQAAPADGDARIRAFVDRYAPVLLAGRISRLTTQASKLAFAAELTAGVSPPAAPFADRLTDLARVCRESHELAARVRDGKPGTDSLRASVTKLARECLDEAPLPATAPTPAVPPSR